MSLEAQSYQNLVLFFRSELGLIHKGQHPSTMLSRSDIRVLKHRRILVTQRNPFNAYKVSSRAQRVLKEEDVLNETMLSYMGQEASE